MKALWTFNALTTEEKNTLFCLINDNLQNDAFLSVNFVLDQYLIYINPRAFITWKMFSEKHPGHN